MALSLKLDLRHKQSLVMTPQLMQAIKLLQMSNLELESAIREEVEKNPLLEHDTGAAGDAGDEPAVAEAAGEGEADRADAGEWPAASDDWSVPEAPAAAEALSEAAGADAFDGPPPADGPLSLAAPGSAEPAGTADLDSGSDPHLVDEGAGLNWQSAASGRGGHDEDGDFDAIANAAARPVTLREHVERQILALGLSETEERVAVYLAGCLDDTGYLPTPVEELAIDIGTAPGKVAAVLARLKGLDPAGVFAADLTECLALQLAERNRLDPVMRTVLDNLPLLARRDYQRLKRLARIDDEDLADVIDEIRALDPKPGLAFDAASARPVVPDVFVRRRPDGSWHVELNAETLPRVLVDRRYYAVASRHDPATKAWLNDCLASANWLVKSLDQRARTILKVASAIVSYQSAFFEHGIDQLRPLTLKTIAETIEMHESTVSRVTANKYISCPRGLFEFKYFFSVSLPATTGGDGVSAETVRHRIRALIEQESPDAILSDDQIVATLKASGVDIARRTVAKYRELMNIPSSVQRRREKTARAVAGTSA